MGLGFGARGEAVQLENGDRAEMVTLCAFMWPAQYHKCPFLKWRGKPIFRAEGKRETFDFWCALVGLLGAVRNQFFGWADLPVCPAETEIYSMF